MRYFIASWVFFISLTVMCGNVALSQQRDEGGVVEYPDGALGMDIGGGYQAMPDEQGDEYDVLPAPEYREPYKSTRYGAQLDEGFVGTFPGFSFKERGTPSPQLREEQELEIEEYIFYESTTTQPASPFWGVSGPAEETDKDKTDE
ncbi:MAG: hypothetical protein GF409_00205 [Candidatus Omnitrophica bacterium]|nr:hypothetical protein [Candidatus Omnitrophota bacterium]